MSYKIILSNGTTLGLVSDGVVDTTFTSIKLIGKNSVNFGQAQNNDLVHILENFANSIPPANPLTGQLWYNSANNALSVYSVGLWEPLAVVTYSASAPASARLANLWFDTTVKQLKIHDGTMFNTLGPEAVSGFGKTRMASESVKDVSGINHAVIKCTLNGTIIAVLSSDEFDVSYDNAIDGIPHVFSGITMKSGYTFQGLSLTSSQANLLLGTDQATYRPASTSATKNSIVERDSYGGIAVSTLTASTLYSSSGKISGVWNVNGSIVPLTDFGASLGSPDLHWSHVYSDAFDSNTVSANTVITDDATITDLKFTNISDNFNNTISLIDKDSSLTAYSDNRLTTQKAIKTYVDTAVASALATMSNSNSTLQTQLNTFTNVPSGAIFYHAGLAAPTGYLVANGSTVSKTTYYNLWLALGGESSPYGQTFQTFNLPDLRGEFIRGLDISRGIDPGRITGSIQSSQNLSHSHSALGGTNFIVYPAVSGQALQEQEQEGGPQSYSSRTPNTSISGGTEARPRNVALLPIIKT